MASTQFPISRKKMYLFFAIVDSFVGIARYFMFPEKGIVFHLVGYVLSVIGFILIWESILLAGRKLEQRLPLHSNPYARFSIQTLITYFIIIFPSFFFNPEISTMLRIIGYLFYFLVAAVMNLIYFGVIYFFNWKENLVSLANMQREQATVKYDALKNQLNPHFLFNALTSLNSLIFESQQLASDYLQQLSKVFRYVLQHKEKETVSVATEINFISNYIYLLKTRFGDAIEIAIDIRQEFMDKEIVPVTLQILIENAVKHNIVCHEEPLVISISADEHYIDVTNNLHKKNLVETSNKQGLKNLKTLYQYLAKAPLEIIETSNTFSVKIPLI